MSAIGARIPLVRDLDDGFAMLRDYNNVARQNLKMLVLTVPGERMMDPDFGVGASRFLFEQVGPDVFTRFKSRLLRQQQKYLPYLVIKDVQFVSAHTNPAMPENRVDIKIFYYNKVLRTSDLLSLPVTT